MYMFDFHCLLSFSLFNMLLVMCRKFLVYRMKMVINFSCFLYIGMLICM